MNLSFFLSNQHKPFPFSSPFISTLWPPSIGLSLIFSIANQYLFFFSLSKHLYKRMARIQPSFLHFYLFRPPQQNTSFLLTSKVEKKYPRGSFPKQPKPLFCPLLFTTVPRSTFFLFFNSKRGYFIYLFIQLVSVLYFSFKKNSTPCP